MRGVHALAVIQPRVFVRSEKEKRVLTSLGVQIGPACQARRSISSPTIPRRVLNFGVFVPDALLACRLVSNGANALVGAAGMLCRRPSPVFPVVPHVLRPISSARSSRYLLELMRSRIRPFPQSHS